MKDMKVVIVFFTETGQYINVTNSMQLERQRIVLILGRFNKRFWYKNIKKEYANVTFDSNPLVPSLK
jgi:hypothetical protein